MLFVLLVVFWFKVRFVFVKKKFIRIPERSKGTDLRSVAYASWVRIPLLVIFLFYIKLNLLLIIIVLYHHYDNLSHRQLCCCHWHHLSWYLQSCGESRCQSSTHKSVKRIWRNDSLSHELQRTILYHPKQSIAKGYQRRKEKRSKRRHLLAEKYLHKSITNLLGVTTNNLCSFYIKLKQIIC